MSAAAAVPGSIGSDMDASLERYHRQMLLPGFGKAAQQRLGQATAAIIGCGALGSVSADMLARAGVGRLLIADRDYLELTNLQRQVLFDEGDVAEGLPKAEAARRHIASVNSQVVVNAVVEDVNHANIEALLDGCDVILDGVDNFETRFLINDVAVKLGVPYLYAGAVGTVGMTYAILPHTPAGDRPWERAGRATPCLRCIFEQMPPPGMSPSCDTAGVLGPVVAVTANHQAAEALKVLTANWDAVNPCMTHVDLWHNTHHQFQVAQAYETGACVCCHQRRFEHLEGRFGSATTTLCGRNAVQLTHGHGGGPRLDFEEIAGRLRPHGSVKANAFMLQAEIVEGGESYVLTLFTDGRAIIKGTREPTVARSLYARYVGA